FYYMTNVDIECNLCYGYVHKQNDKINDTACGSFGPLAHSKIFEQRYWPVFMPRGPEKDSDVDITDRLNEDIEERSTHRWLQNRQSYLKKYMSPLRSVYPGRLI